MALKAKVRVEVMEGIGGFTLVVTTLPRPNSEEWVTNLSIDTVDIELVLGGNAISSKGVEGLIRAMGNQQLELKESQ